MLSFPEYLNETITIIKEHDEDGLVETIWEATYLWTKPRPATYLEPPEGGCELDDGPNLVQVKVFNDNGDLVWMVGGKDMDYDGFSPPSDYDIFEAFEEDINARLERDDEEREF